MSDNFIRHFIATCALLVALLLYWVGYLSAGFGWWWTMISVIGIYLIVYKLVDA